MKYEIKQFEELTIHELYGVLKLRYDVYVQEQKSIYDEFDNRDQKAIHFICKIDGMIIGYSRVTVGDSIARIGRVVVSKDHRKKGIAKELMNQCIDYIKEKLNVKQIIVGAQEYLEQFYSSLGFIKVKGQYDDCGIPHVDMILKL